MIDLDLLFRVLLPVVLGIVGWYFANWLGTPIVAITNLRREVHEAIFFAANVGPSADESAVTDARVRLRTLAAKLAAIAAATPWIGFVTGYDARRAAMGLVGLSNAIGTPDLVLHRDIAQQALKLPRDHTNEEIAQVRAAILRRGQESG